MNFILLENIKQYKGAALSVLWILLTETRPLNASSLSKLSGYTDKPIAQVLRRLMGEGLVLKTNYGYVLNQQVTAQKTMDTQTIGIPDPSISTRKFSATQSKIGDTSRINSDSSTESAIMGRKIIESPRGFSDVRERINSEAIRIYSRCEQKNPNPGLDSIELDGQNSDLNRNFSENALHHPVKDLDSLRSLSNFKDLKNIKDQEQNKKVFKT